MDTLELSINFLENFYIAKAKVSQLEKPPEKIRNSRDIFIGHFYTEVWEETWFVSNKYGVWSIDSLDKIKCIENLVWEKMVYILKVMRKKNTSSQSDTYLVISYYKLWEED